jgi:hypothetical protein
MAQHSAALNLVPTFEPVRVHETNRVPSTDRHDNPTGCCPRFHPERWDGQALHFEAKPFARTVSRGVKHVPQDMAPAYAAAASAIEKAKAWEDQQMLVLNRVLQARQAEHLFAVSKAVPGMELVRLDGDYRTKVFEGAYAQAPQWQGEFQQELAQEGLLAEQIYLYFTTCPACSEFYGRNYVVAVAKLQG